MRRTRWLTRPPSAPQAHLQAFRQWNFKSETEVAKSCPTLCDPMDCSLPGSSVHGIFQARVLEWVAISFSKNFKKDAPFSITILSGFGKKMESLIQSSMEQPLLNTLGGFLKQLNVQQHYIRAITFLGVCPWAKKTNTSVHHCCSVAQLCPIVCDPVDCSTPGLPVRDHLLELPQTHVHRVSDVI